MSYIKDYLQNAFQEFLSQDDIQSYLHGLFQDFLSRDDVIERFSNSLYRTLSEKVLHSISRGFDIHVKDMLRPKIGPKEEYTVFESTHPATLWFLIDLSAAREGDLFDVKLYIKLSGGEFYLHAHHELENQMQFPMATLSAQFAPACRLTVTQSRGLSKDVRYEVFGRYEGK